MGEGVSASESVEDLDVEPSDTTPDTTDAEPTNVASEAEHAESVAVDADSDDAPAPDADAPEGQSGEAPPAKTHDIIFVGAKPIMTYVNATLTLIRSTPVVTLKARGRHIKQAVDVALTIVKRMSAVGYSIRDVRISSSPLDSLDGKTRNISTIEIEIQKSDS